MCPAAATTVVGSVIVAVALLHLRAAVGGAGQMNCRPSTVNSDSSPKRATTSASAASRSHSGSLGVVRAAGQLDRRGSSIVSSGVDARPRVGDPQPRGAAVGALPASRL